MATESDSLFSLDGFLAEHPWPERFRPERFGRSGKPLEWLWDFELTCAPEKLWAHLIDTSRLNRALGLGEMSFEERDGVLHGSARNAGVLQEWVEEPWTWVTGSSLTAIRSYSRGFAHVARAVYQVVESDDGPPRLLVYFGWVPRNLIGSLALKIGVPPLRKAYAGVLERLQADADKPRPEPYVAKREALPAAVDHRINGIRSQLAGEGVDLEILDRLLTLLRAGDELDLYRIQPRKLAHEWDVSERALISVCLHATRAGLLDLSWDVICPHCRGVRDESTALAGLAGNGSCEVCDIDFSTDFENAVEVTFHVHASIVDIPKVYYCSAEPATKQHIKVQQALEPGASRSIEARLSPGRYRMRTRGDKLVAYLNVKDSGEPSIRWRSGEALDELDAGPGVTIELVNDGAEQEMFVIEEVRWADEALRPSMLFSLQEFRDLFSEEYLSSDVQLSVGEQTLIFTDMVGSTAFYREHGDPAAFVKVKEHFEVVFPIVRDNGGAVVKTIGDAVMAVFSDPLGAVKAARDINVAFPAVEGDPDAIRLRVSLNSGPCIAVNLNTGIDYFGGTVNTAAKLQACAEAGEVALSRRVFEAPGVEAYFDSLGAASSYDERSFELASGETIDYIFWRVS